MVKIEHISFSVYDLSLTSKIMWVGEYDDYYLSKNKHRDDGAESNCSVLAKAFGGCHKDDSKMMSINPSRSEDVVD